MPLTVGGGVRKVEDIRALLNAGADKVSINSAAVSLTLNLPRQLQHFGRKCIVVNFHLKNWR